MAFFYSKLIVIEVNIGFYDSGRERRFYVCDGGRRI